MEKIYEQAKDLHVKNYIVYAGPMPAGITGPDDVNKTFYDDSRCQIVSDFYEVFDAFNKGILMVLDNDEAATATDYVRDRVTSAVPWHSETSVLSGWKFYASFGVYYLPLPHEDTSNPEKTGSGR